MHAVLSAIEAFFTAAASLWSLLLGSLIAATLAPVSSEAIVGAGWLRLDWRACLACMATGRAIRYLRIAAATQ